jgi:hypothetical protein
MAAALPTGGGPRQGLQGQAPGPDDPQGVYDPSRDEGSVGVGVAHDTAEFAVESIRRWWPEMRSLAYPEGSPAADCRFRDHGDCS